MRNPFIASPDGKTLVAFGESVESINKQFPELPKRSANLAQRAADAIMFLGVHGYLTPAAQTSARKKIVSDINRETRPKPNSAKQSRK